jgi:hypothetical protein
MRRADSMLACCHALLPLVQMRCMYSRQLTMTVQQSMTEKNATPVCLCVFTVRTLWGGRPLYLPYLKCVCSHGGRPLYLLFLRILGSCPITWLLVCADGERSIVLELGSCRALLLLLLWRSPAIFASPYLTSFCGRPQYLPRLKHVATAVARVVALQSVQLSLAFTPYGIVLANSHASYRVGFK